MAHSPHRQWKGCRLCSPHKDKRNGRPVRDPWREVRKTGLKRRYGRRWTPDEN